MLSFTFDENSFFSETNLQAASRVVPQPSGTRAAPRRAGSVHTQTGSRRNGEGGEGRVSTLSPSPAPVLSPCVPRAPAWTPCTPASHTHSLKIHIPLFPWMHFVVPRGRGRTTSQGCLNNDGISGESGRSISENRTGCPGLQNPQDISGLHSFLNTIGSNSIQPTASGHCDACRALSLVLKKQR